MLHIVFIIIYVFPIWILILRITATVCMYLEHKNPSFKENTSITLALIGSFIGMFVVSANTLFDGYEPKFTVHQIIMSIIVGVPSGIIPFLILAFVVNLLKPVFRPLKKHPLTLTSLIVLSLVTILFLVNFIPLFWGSAIEGDLVPAIIAFLILAIPLCFLPLFLMVLLILRIKKLNSILSHNHQRNLDV